MSELLPGNNKIKYFAYVRKSSEQKERQALSIPAQIQRLRDQFKHLDFEIITDEKSAFKPHNRPGFARMIERMQAGERTGLIAWHPDRLSRNEVDASTLTYSIRMGVIQDVLFATYNFDNTPEGIWMLQMALSQSQYESAKKGKDVKRGSVAKCKMGWRPGVAPEGYVNYEDTDKVKKIKKDKRRSAIFDKIFASMLTGNYTPPQILKIATNEWGLLTRGGNELARSGIYNLFTRRFYCGEFEYPVGSGNWYQGKHEPYITKEEYDKIQRILGRDGRPRSKRHSHAYTGLIQCGNCGCMITQEHKTKRLKNGSTLFYYLAHCTRKKPDVACKQPSIQVQYLEDQILEVLKSIKISPELHRFALKWLRQEHEKEADNFHNILEVRENALESLKKKKSRLISMRVNGELTEEEFLEEKRKLEYEMQSFQSSLSVAQCSEQGWLSLGENMLLFQEKAFEKFKNGSIEEKRAIFTALGSNRSFIDKKLSIDLHPCLVAMKSVSDCEMPQNVVSEPQETYAVKGYFDAWTLMCPSVLAHRDDVRTSLKKTKDKTIFDVVKNWSDTSQTSP